MVRPSIALWGFCATCGVMPICRHSGYGVSQRRRKRVEEIFGWMKTTGLLRKLRHRGGPLVAWIFTFTAAAYNLVRLRNLVAAPA